MSESKTTWEERAAFCQISDISAQHSYQLAIEEFKEALKKEIEKEIAINDKLANSKDKKILGYLKYCNYGLEKAIKLIDTVQPIQDDTGGNKQEKRGYS